MVHKLVINLTGPSHVIVAGEHVCTGEDMVTGQRLQVHVAKMRQYPDASLDVTEELKVIVRIQGEGELRMPDVINIGRKTG